MGRCECGHKRQVTGAFGRRLMMRYRRRRWAAVRGHQHKHQHQRSAPALAHFPATQLAQGQGPLSIRTTTATLSGSLPCLAYLLHAHHGLPTGIPRRPRDPRSSPPTASVCIETNSSFMASGADDTWEQAEGVPSLSDPFIQKYLSGRDALVEQEKKQRSGPSRSSPSNF